MALGIIIVVVVGCVIVFGLGLFFVTRAVFGQRGTGMDVEQQTQHSPPRAQANTSDTEEERVWSPRVHDPEFDFPDENRSVYSCRSCLTGLDAKGERYWEQDKEEAERGSFLAFPSCANASLHDWGLGLKACHSCGARPILNRGCLHCEKPMCATCFEAHKELKTSTLILAKAAIRKYDKSNRGSLSVTDWNELLRDLGVQPQTEEEFNASCSARGADPQTVGITFQHLIVLVSFLAPNTSEALARLVPQYTVGSEMLCLTQQKMHDWGPGIAKCGLCNVMPILNRGCRACNKRMCQKCWEKHRVSSVTGQKVEMSPVSPKSPGGFEPSSALLEGKAEEVASSPLPKCSVVFPDNFGSSIPVASKASVMSEWHVLDDCQNVKRLNEGGALYYFTFLKGTHLTLQNREMSAKLLNMSSFRSEQEENNVPFIDPLGEADMSEYIFMLNKAVYMMPSSVKLEDLTKELIITPDYQARCQPGGVKVFEVNEPDTFRFCKTIIWPVYKLTMQFKVSIVDKKYWKGLASFQDGLEVHHALLLERTKRNKLAEDVIKKAKSVLLYHRVESGAIMVTNVTTGAASSIPTIIASVVDKVCTFLFSPPAIQSNGVPTSSRITVLVTKETTSHLQPQRVPAR